MMIHVAELHLWSSGNKEAAELLKWTKEAAAKLAANEGMEGFTEFKLLVTDKGARNHELVFLKLKWKWL